MPSAPLGLRVALAAIQGGRRCGWVGLLFPSPYHGVLVVKVCALCVCLRPGGRLEPVTTALRRAVDGLGQSRPMHGVDHDARSFFFFHSPRNLF